MSTEHRRIGPRYDLAAHLELARAFPALAERLKPLLLTEIEIECPAGHKLKVIAQLVAAGRAVFCPKCRRAFEPALHPAVEVPEVFETAPPPGSAPPQARSTGDAGLAREGLTRIAEGTGLLLRAAGGRLLGSLKRAAERAAGPLGSLAVHAGLLLLAMFLGIKLEVVRPEPDEPLTADFAPVEKKEFVSKVKKRDIFHKIHENEQPLEIPLPELRDAQPPEPIDEIEEEKPEKLPGEPLPTDELAWMPTEIFGPRLTGPPGVLGVGQTGRPGAFALRGDRGRRLDAARRGGGGPDTEGAVQRALEWLARNQEKDGSWSLEGKGRAAAAGRWWAARARQMRPAMTGFATLAFLGAGYTSKADTKYRGNVRKAVAWLVANQRTDGSYPGRTERCTYTQAVVALALAEAYGMSRDPAMRAAAQKALDCAVRNQNPYAGWDYHPRGGTSDTSITVWNCLALKSARAAGLRVDMTAVQGIRNWLNAAQDMTGRGRGSDWIGGAFAYRGKPGRRLQARGGVVTVMHPAGLLMRLMTGSKPTEKVCYGPANLLLTAVPESSRERLGEEELQKRVEAFIKGNYLRWDALTDGEKAAARTRAARRIALFPRTVEEYIRQRYGRLWNRYSEGQQFVLREAARRAIAAQPKTVEEYIDKFYRPWKTFTEAEREQHRRYARERILKELYGAGFPRSIYFLYHSSLAMFQMGGRHWGAWNPQMKKALLEGQAARGAEEGSWAPAMDYGMCQCIGRTMSTALGAMTLEVYYRYLRIYE